MAAGCMQCLRWSVFVLNLLLWLVGMGTLGTALWLRFDPEVSSYMELHDGLSDFYIGCYILIAVGALMSILGFLGCCGAMRKSQCMLVSFFILLLVVFIGELACALLAYTHQDTVRTYIERSMYDTVYHHYYRKAAFTDVFDRIQSGLECCGVKSYKDWLHSYYATEVQAAFTDVFDRIQSGLECCGVKSYKDWLHSYYATEVQVSYHHYYRKAAFTDVFDRIQSGLECCGVKSYKDWLHSYYATEVQVSYHHYYRKAAFTDVFDRIQSGLECCGVKSYKDWLHSYYATEVQGSPELGIGASDTGRVPESCCNEQGRQSYPSTCGKEFDQMPLWTYDAFLHKQGCADVMYAKFYSNLDVMIGLSVGVGAFQLLGMILTMLLCCWVNRKTGRYGYED